ncbi:MAG: hypothetical protein ABGY29_02170 [bacterium]
MKRLPHLLALVALLVCTSARNPLPAAAQEPLPDHWILIERLAELEGQSEPFQAVVDHMAGVVKARSGVPGRLTCVDRALTEPWSVPALARELRDTLSAVVEQKDGSFASTWVGIAAHLDQQPPAASEHPGLADLDGRWDALADPELSGLPLLEALSDFVGAANGLLAAGLSKLSPPERRLLFSGGADFREAWYQGHFPGVETSAENAERVADWVHLLADAPFDHALYRAVAERLARLGEQAFVTTLVKRLGDVKERPKLEGFSGDLRAVVGAGPADRVVLGGKGKGKYGGPAALVIDLGGNDQYTRAAVVDGADALVSIVLDLAGNDTYEGACATATGGVALLFDAKGKDKYQGGRFTQAAATFGVALLVDRSGNDTYRMEDYGQGHALAGTALLYDLGGDDTYEAWAFAQGGGLAGGLSALVDADGDDSYLADLHWPDVYGNSGPNIYHGASQGYCTGIRSNGGAAGGLAALLDLGDGEDRYQSGNFSQGGAYYFSFALMYDGGGDDENFGTRYSQGFGVHQAAAVRWDAGGDDTYTCRSVAHTGMAWDEGVGYLLEDGGDDVYDVGDLGNGGAAQTGVAILIDLDGKDSYKSGSAGQGGTGSSEYHNKPSIGVLIDLGGDKDQYSNSGRGDGERRVTEGVEIFLDSKAKSFEKALRSLR